MRRPAAPANLGPTLRARLTPAALLLTLCAGPALADGFDEGQARSRIAAAGYAGVGSVHQGNLGDWMAEADKDGQHVLVVLHPDGRVDLRQQVQVSPVPIEPLPVPKAAAP